MAQKRSKQAQQAPNVDFLKHNVDRDQYEKWESFRRDPEKFPDYDTDYAPFGRAMGKDPDDPSKQKMLNIMGPAALHQIWPPDSIGEEWRRKPEKKEEGLLADQITRIETDILRDVQFVRPLGRGSWGQVIETTAELLLDNIGWTRFRFACKVIRHEEKTQRAIDSSFADYKVLRYLRHENICNLAEVSGIPDPETGFPYAIVCLFLEICDGDLNNLHAEAQQHGVGKEYGTENYKRWILPERLSLHWFAQIARALDYLHGNNVSHQDMKLANIVYLYVNPLSQTYVDRFLSATFKLTDFGNAICQVTPSRTQESRYESDINWLYLLLYKIGVPAPEQTFRQPLEFATKCKTGNLEASELDHWISPDMIDLLGNIGVSANRLTALQILLHPWLQNNAEPRTEPFIVRSYFDYFAMVDLDPILYQDWEDQRENPALYPNYAPFGGWPQRHRIWDRETQTWIHSGLHLPIHGAANKIDLIIHDIEIPEVPDIPEEPGVE